MKTYQDHGYMYWFDTSLKLWTICKVDTNGELTEDEASYENKKQDLQKRYPQLDFTVKIEVDRDWKKDTDNIVFKIHLSK
jgi:hypothetical protein